MIKAYKFCIKPNTAQQELLQHQFDAARDIYNCSLALKSYAYKKFKVKLGLKELKSRLPKLRKRHAWSKQADSQVLQQSVINLDTAYNNFFTGKGLIDVVYCSNNYHVANPKHLCKHQKILNKLQRVLSRKTK